MSADLYDWTVSGAILGGLTGIKSVSIGAESTNFDREYLAEDTGQSGKAYPLTNTPGQATVTLKWNATTYDALKNAAQAQTKETTLTIAKTGVGTWTGACYVQSVGERQVGVDKMPEFTVTFEPETQWAYAT
jgi:hypothetical protein